MNEILQIYLVTKVKCDPVSGSNQVIDYKHMNVFI